MSHSKGLGAFGPKAGKAPGVGTLAGFARLTARAGPARRQVGRGGNGPPRFREILLFPGEAPSIRRYGRFNHGFWATTNDRAPPGNGVYFRLPSS